MSRIRTVGNIPRNYARQHGLTCGEYNVRTIVESFSRPFHTLAHLPVRVKLLGFSFVQDIQRLLEWNGLSAPIRHASNLNASAKLSLIQEHIDRGEPVLLAIGNGHIHRNRYSPVARLLIGHFITVYGYDDERELFYIYDPYLEGMYPEEIPIGNEVRTFSEFLRDWQGPLYYKFINMDHVYLPVRTR